MIKAVEDSASNFVQGFLGSNLILSLFLITVLQFLWGLINTLQIIVLTVLFSVTMPVNCYRIMIVMMQICNLDVIDVSPYLEAMFTFKAEWPALNATFADANYESSNFIMGLGFLFFVTLFSTLMFLLRLLCARICCVPFDDNCIKRRLHSRLKLVAIIVRFLIEGCIELGLVALISIVSMSSEHWNSMQDALCQITAILTFVGLCMVPFYLRMAGRRLIAYN